MSEPKIDLTGKKYGMLTVVELVGKNQRGFVWKCKCKCGNEVELNTGYLNKKSFNANRNCGCIDNKVTSNVKENRRLYKIWSNIKQFVTNVNNPNYHRYKYIPLYKPWNDFLKFKSWSLSNGYHEFASVKFMRKDTSKGFTPTNCHFKAIDKKVY